MTDAPNVALAFPGQGIEPDRLREVLRAHSDHPLVIGLDQHLRAEGLGSIERTDLTDTRVVQPATVACGLIAARSRSLNPVAVAGHSVGELAAMAYAGVMSDSDACELAWLRGQASGLAHAARPGSMTALIGLDIVGAEAVRRNVVSATALVVDIAALNGPRQVVLAGDVHAIGPIADAARQLRGLAKVLPIGGAFHSSLMIDAARSFGNLLARYEFGHPCVPLVSSVDGAVHHEAGALPELAALSLVVPVRWMDVLGCLIDMGVTHVIDVGPGDTLTRLGRRVAGLVFEQLPSPGEPDFH